MILSEKIVIKVSYNTLKYYLGKGYDAKANEELEIKVSDLQTGSKEKIHVSCDNCKVEYDIPYQKYLKNYNNQNIFLCKKCCHLKNKMTNFGELNIEKLTQNDNFKNKMINIENTFQDFTQNIEDIEKKSDIFKQQFLEKNREYYVTKINYEKQLVNILCSECDKVYEIDVKLFDKRKLSDNKMCIFCNPISEKDKIVDIKECIKKQNNIVNEKTVLEDDKVKVLLYEYIKSYYQGEIITNYVISDSMTLDIYLPEFKLGFEYAGLSSHNELFVDRNYHYNKTENCKKIDIKLIHIYEDEWRDKEDIVKSRILNLLKINPIRYYARKCEIKIVNDKKMVRDFLNQNHLQGSVQSNINIGLYLNNELISLMTFGQKRLFMNSKSKEGEFELLRFCNKLNTSVVGAASRLMKYFIEKYNPVEITTYADRSWSNGDLYETIGFKYDSKTAPNYHYIVNGERKHRFGFRKDVLVQQGFDKNMTEHDIMLSRKLYRIFNSGNFKYIWKKDN